MRNIVIVGCALIGLLASSSLWAAKSCEELKQEIAANISGNGVVGYDLLILPNAQAQLELNAGHGAKVIGSCGGGTQKIVYWRDGKPDMQSSEPSKTPFSQPQADEVSKSSPLGLLITK